MGINFFKRLTIFSVVLNLSLLLYPYAQQQSSLSNDITPQPAGVHAEQMEEIKNLPIVLEPDKIEALKYEALERSKILAKPRSVVHAQDSKYIIFGYQQSDAGYDYHYRWHAITHIASSFVSFNASGNLSSSTFTNRAGDLKAGGTAQANGVKVIMVITPSNFSTAIQYSVLTNATNRANLVSQVVSTITSDGYCQGVSLDFEPYLSNTNARDGLAALCHALSTTLKNISPNYEISYYANSSYSATQFSIANTMPYLDYIMYSCYDYGTGSSVHAITDINNFIPSVNGYLDAGVPESKMVLTISSYGRNWSGVTTYNQTGTKRNSNGFVAGLYNTTLNPKNGGPYTANYVRGDEAGWYTYPNSTTSVWESQDQWEYNSRLTRSWQDTNNRHNGKRLRGIGYWSLYWFATANSYDPITHAAAAKTRLYGHLFQLNEEIFNTPGDKNYLFEKFEGPNAYRDVRWRNPSESPDTKGISTTSAVLTAAPAGTGKPANSDNAMQVAFTFVSTSNNRLFFRHEILNDNTDTNVTDINAAKVIVNRNTKIRAYVNVAGSGLPDKQLRMVVMETSRQVECSYALSLATAGWQLMEWNLNDPSQLSAYTTAEPAFITGSGTLNASTTGDKDVAFIGFVIEGGTLGSGTVYFDELQYTPTNPPGQNYVINEFRYNNPTTEFIEIYGPAGTLPTGMQLRFYNSTNGSVSTAIDLSGTITDSGNGYGYFVIGDTGIPNVNQVFTSSASQNIPNTTPGDIQLYNAANGNVYDSIVFQANGGLADLIRKQTLNVTQNGDPWIGEIGPGTNNSGVAYTLGRYPNGANTWINGNDFSFMPATPGAPNGNSVPDGATFDFTTAPANAYQTYQSFNVANPVSAGIPASPSGGNAYQCVDLVSGGGTMGFIGDPSLGSSTGYQVTGELYLPLSTDSAQAIGIGICGRQGSNFFTSSTTTLNRTGYESGYWLIYENASGVGLNDGLVDHPGTFNFVYAHNRNTDTTKVDLLGSAANPTTGGAWVSFTLAINSQTNQLIANINNSTIYSGPIPSGAPTSGAFQIGFRENHGGLPSTSEGTWIDNLHFSGQVIPILDWQKYSNSLTSKK